MEQNYNSNSQNGEIIFQNGISARQNSLWAKRNSRLFSLVAKVLVCVLICIQLFPPLMVLDGTSLRHFLIAAFDIVALGFVVAHTYRCKFCPIRQSSLTRPLIAVWLVLLAYMGVSMLWAINPTESLAVWNRWIVVILSAVLACNFMLYENKTFKMLIVCTLVIATINVLSCIICYYVFDVHISQRNNLKITGFYGNKNFFAVALLYKLPFLYYAFLRYRGFIRWYSLAMVLCVTFSLVIISARASFIGLALQLGLLMVYGVYSFWRCGRKKRDIFRFLCPIVVAIVGFFAGNGFIEYNFERYAAKNAKNNYTVEARLGSIAEGNSKGRLIIWRNTAKIIKEKPLTGYGVGNHKIAIMKVECAQKHDYIVSDHAHNDFLEMFSELGIVGVCIYILTYVFAAVETLKQMFAKRSHEIYRLKALVGGSLVLTYMNDALFNFPLERADCQIYLALGLALLLSNGIKQRGEKNRSIGRPILIALAVLAVPLFVLETMHCYSSVMQKQRILQHNGDKTIRLSAEQWERRTPVFPNMDESTHPRAVNIAERYANEKNYRRAIDILLADNSNPYYSLREYRLANYYNKAGIPDSASLWARRCMEMKPLCYSPVRVLVSIAGQQLNKEEQMRLIDNYLTLYQKDPLAWEDKINLLLKEGRKDEALQTCDKALEFVRKNRKITALKEKIRQENQEKSAN